MSEENVSNETEATNEAPAILLSPTTEEKQEGKQEAGAPEAYTDFTMPEGVSVDAPLMDGFKSLAKELNLSQEAAQKLVNLQAEATKRSVDENAKAWEQAQEKWKAEVKADKEIGGADFDKNIGVAKKGLKLFGNEAFIDMLESTGVGNHPEMVKFLHRVGKAIKEDGAPVTGKQVAGAVKDTAKLLFPTMNS